MHGRKRATTGPSPEQLAIQEKKLAAYQKLKSIVFTYHSQRIYTPEAMALNAQFLSLNPDVYTLWNYRRNALTAAIPPEGALAQVVATELQLSQAGISKNPKSYYAWHHRQWVLGRWGAGSAAAHLHSELALCGKLLDADERNFHCWKYRMWVVALFQQQPRLTPLAAETAKPLQRGSTEDGSCESSEVTVPPREPNGQSERVDGVSVSVSEVVSLAPPVVAAVTAPASASPPTSAAAAVPDDDLPTQSAAASSELSYTTDRISRNFSNYSAWHYRTRLLVELHCGDRSSSSPVSAAFHAAAASDACGRHSELPVPALPLTVLSDELRLVREAVFTEPDDQSPWFFRRWLLTHVAAACAGDATVGAARLLEEDIAALRELAAAESTSKWPLLAIAQALEVLLRLHASGIDGSSHGSVLALKAELGALYGSALPRTDPLHAAFYASEHTRVLGTAAASGERLFL